MEPMPFWEALAYLEGKEAVASAMTNAEWQRMPLAIRTKSFFSATLTSAKAAQAITDYCTGYVRGDKAINDQGQEYQVYQGRAEFVAQMRDIMAQEGFGKVLHDGTLDPVIHDNDLRDLRGCRRLQLIFDTQTEQAASYAQWQEGQDPDILDIYPCQKFVRARSVHSPRPYHDDAIGEIRRKDDLEFWIGLNRDFGVPWGPWGFNSGCAVEDVDRDEAEALGIIKPTDTVRSIAKEFTDGLEESIRGLDDSTRRWIQAQMEGKVRFLGDIAAYKPDKPQPSASASVPPHTSDPARPVKTPEQIETQKKRIGDTISARQKKQGEERAAIQTKAWADFIKRRDDALAPLVRQETALLDRYGVTGAPADWDAYLAAKAARQKAMQSWTPGGMLYKATANDITKKQAASRDKTYRDSLRYLSVDGVVIPKDKRGIIIPTAVKIDRNHQVRPDKPQKLTPNVRTGLDAACAIINPDKLPPSLGIQIVKGTDIRAFAFSSNIKISDKDTPAVIAHELAHVIEDTRPDILRKSADFLYTRAKGEGAMPLKKLYPYHGYGAQEKAIEDDWIKRGGSAYTGKIYMPGYNPSMSRESFVNRLQGSEILSMGIQRMLESPVDFHRQDPEFYNFIKSQLS